MASQVSDATRRKRRDRAMSAQLDVSRSIAASLVGRELKALVERPASREDVSGAKIESWEHGLIRQSGDHPEPPRGRYMIARGEADAPDIDGRIYTRGKLPEGNFAMVKIVGHTDYDLIAEPA
jgi:ribosomal protein S12 methylthiotransferase